MTWLRRSRRERERERAAYARRLVDDPEQRRELCERILARKRAEHAELARPLTWWSALRILRREDILLTQTRTGTLAGRAMRFRQGDYGILLDNSWRNHGRKTAVLAHELAHVWLHCWDDELTEALREELGTLLCRRVRKRYPLNERVEAEADYIAAELRGRASQLPDPAACQ